MDCNCNKPKPSFPKAPLVINNNCDPVLFHKATHKASLGTDLKGQPDYVDPSSLDYKNVLLVFEATNNAYLYSSDGIPTFISYVPSDQNVDELLEKINQEILDRTNADKELSAEISNNTSNITKNSNDIATLTTKVNSQGQTLAELDETLDSINSSIDDIDSSVENLTDVVNSYGDTTVQTNTAVSGDASTVVLTKTTGQLGGTQTETAIPLPVADSTQAGVMNPATFNAVQENAENIDSILGGAIVLQDLPAEPTDEQLTTAWKTATGKTELINRASIYDETNKKVWYYYENAGTWKPISTDGTEVTVNIATNDTAGIVKGSTEDGQMAVEADGSMSLNGYDGITHDIDNLTQLVAGIEVPKLPTSMVYDFVSPVGVNNPSTADNANITARVVNTTTGAITNATLMMPMASGTQAGSVTAAEKTKLDTLPAITEIGENLELTDDGVLNASGGSEYILPAYVAGLSNPDYYYSINVSMTGGTGVGLSLPLYNSRTGKVWNGVKYSFITPATPTRQGIMSAADKSKLDSLLAITSLNDSLELDENGQLSVVGGGDSSNLEEYTLSAPNLEQLFYALPTAESIVLRGNVTLLSDPEGGANLSLTTLPAATTTKAGLMLPADRTKLSALGVSSLTNMDGVLQSDTDVQIEFTRANLTTGASETQTATIEAATTEEAGVMLPTDKTKLDEIPSLTEMQWTRVENLPPAVVTGFEDTTYGTDTITMHLDTKDLATSGVSVQELMLEGATANTDTEGGHAGLMTAFQATQLATLAAGGGGSGSVLNDWGTSTTVGLSQGFLTTQLKTGSQGLWLGGSEPYEGNYRNIVLGNNLTTSSPRLRGGNICIGDNITLASNSSTTGYLGDNIVIGNNSYAGEDLTTATNNAVVIGNTAGVARMSGIAIGAGTYVGVSGEYGVAIGTNANVANSSSTYPSLALGYEAACGHYNSIALGGKSYTSRRDEVSIGDSRTSSAFTRYLANVKAGVNGTDATNVTQVSSVTTGDVLYASTEAASSITLSTPVSQYEKIEVIGMWNMPYTASTTPLQLIAYWHINDQDNSKTFQIQAIDIDPANSEKTEVVDTWNFTNASTLTLLSNAQISGSLTDQTIETNGEAPYITITKVIGIKSL